MAEGILGDGGLHPGKYNMALVRRAIRNGWNVPEDVKRAVMEQMALVATSSADERNQIAASKVLVAADANDLRVELAEKQQPAATVVNVNTAVQVNNANAEPTSNARRIADALALLDAARARAISSSDATPQDEVHGGPEADATPVAIPVDGLP